MNGRVTSGLRAPPPELLRVWGRGPRVKGGLGCKPEPRWQPEARIWGLSLPVPLFPSQAINCFLICKMGTIMTHFSFCEDWKLCQSTESSQLVRCTIQKDWLRRVFHGTLSLGDAGLPSSPFPAFSESHWVKEGPSQMTPGAPGLALPGSSGWQAGGAAPRG